MRLRMDIQFTQKPHRYRVSHNPCVKFLYINYNSKTLKLSYIIRDCHRDYHSLLFY